MTSRWGLFVITDEKSFEAALDIWCMIERAALRLLPGKVLCASALAPLVVRYLMPCLFLLSRDLANISAQQSSQAQ